MQQAADDSLDCFGKVLTVLVRTLAPSTQSLFFTCATAVSVLRSAAQTVTIFNPTAADLECLATNYQGVTDLTLSGEFDGAILASGVEEGWWSTLQLQRLALQHSVSPHLTDRLLLKCPAGDIRLGPLSLERIVEEAEEEEATRDSIDRRIADARALQNYKDSYDLFNPGTFDEDAKAALDEWHSTWRHQLPAALAAQLAEPVRYLPAVAPHLGLLAALDLSMYPMQKDNMQLLVAAAPNWPRLLSLKLHWTYRVDATDALQHLIAAAPHWPLLQELHVSEEQRDHSYQRALPWEKPAHAGHRTPGAQWEQLAQAGMHWPRMQQLVVPFVPGPGMALAAAAWPKLKVLVLPEFGTAGRSHVEPPDSGTDGGDDNLQSLLQALQRWPLLERLELPLAGTEHGSWMQPATTEAIPGLQHLLLHVDCLNMRAVAIAIEQHWHHLTSLSLAFAKSLSEATHGELADLQPLAAVAAHMPNLQALSLQLADNAYGGKPVGNLTGLSAAATSWPLLTNFSLISRSENREHVASCMQELAAAAPYWPQLGHLELNLRVGSQINVALSAAAHHWRKLTSLQLEYRVRAASASPLHTLAANVSSWPLLQRLTLHAEHGIGPEGCQMLATAAPAWPKLQQLSINFGEVWNVSTYDDGRGMAALAVAAVHWSAMERFELSHMNLYSNWGLQWLAETATAYWPRLTRLDLNTCGELSQQIKYMSKLTSLRELWLPGCTLSTESDLPELRKLPRLATLVLSDASRWLLNGVDMCSESVETQMRCFCCLGCDRRNEEAEHD